MTNPKKIKCRILTKNKAYSLHDSPFYRLRSKKKLADLLCTPINKLNSLTDDSKNYSIFCQIGKSDKIREIQKPEDDLDKIHSRIASLLCRIRTPSYLQSGKKKCSNVTNAKQHLGDFKTLTTDIKAFYPSTTKSKVFYFFYKFLECSPDVADLVADICTYNGHIPTGSRISMPLAFWANIIMFNQLERLSVKHNIVMTVYVDDITFSGNQINRLFLSTVNKIITKQNHCMHPIKTVIYSKNSPKVITGVVVSKGKLLIKNEQHLKMYGEIEQWKVIGFTPGTLSLTNRLLGRLNALSSIDSRYGDKARSLKNSLKK